MSYQFKPLQESELDAEPVKIYKLLPDGEYRFEVLSSKRRTSEAGNNMAELKLSVIDKDGMQYYVYDYLVFSDNNFNRMRIRHFCHAVGLKDEYEKGELPEELSGFGGTVNIGKKDKVLKKDGVSFFPEKNVVVDYIKSDFVAKIPDNTLDDQIPF